MWKKIGIGLLVLLVGAGGGVALGRLSAESHAETELEQQQEAYVTAFTEAFDEALEHLEAATGRISERFEEVDNLKTAQELRLRRYRGRSHLQKARALGVGRVSSEAEADRLVEQDRLVRLEDTPLYYIMWEDLEYSVPYVTPDMARFLERLGERFQARLVEEGLPLYRFCITSILRTAENQQALRRINPNAARGVSTHEFGTTVDIVYHRYDYWPRPEDALPPTPYPFLNERLEPIRSQAYGALGMRYWQELQGILGRTLIELQDEGQAYVLLERNQPVFHITVAQPLAES